MTLCTSPAAQIVIRASAPSLQRESHLPARIIDVEWIRAAAAENQRTAVMPILALRPVKDTAAIDANIGSGGRRLDPNEEAMMERQLWDPMARRWPKGSRSVVVARLLLAATALPLAAAAQARTGLRPAAGWRRGAACAPFDYIPYSDRQGGGVMPGQRVVRIESPNGG